MVELRPSEHEPLSQLQTASRELLLSRALQKRVDQKFIASRSNVADLLVELSDDFRVVLSGDNPWATYLTQYFDSDAFDFFHAHRRGVRPRHKVRVRHYVERDLCFLELKTKDRYSVTTKQRFKRPTQAFDLSPEDRSLISEAIDFGDTLHPSIWLEFSRITLVGVHSNERLTIDVNLQMSTDGVDVAFDESAIIEIKQPRSNVTSPGYAGLRALGIRPHRVSKYCVALSALGEVKRTGVFRPSIRELERVGA